jgi:hypothetical protein
LPAAAGDITAERLDLDHIGALIGEKHRRQWPRDYARQIEHIDSRQWTRHVRATLGLLPEPISAFKSQPQGHC